MIIGTGKKITKGLTFCAESEHGFNFGSICAELGLINENHPQPLQPWEFPIERPSGEHLSMIIS